MSSHRTRRRGPRPLIRQAISLDSTPSRSNSWASGCPSGREWIRISSSGLAARTDPEPTVPEPDEEGRGAVPPGLIEALPSRCGEGKRLRARLGEGTSSGSSRQQVRTNHAEARPVREFRRAEGPGRPAPWTRSRRGNGREHPILFPRGGPGDSGTRPVGERTRPERGPRCPDRRHARNLADPLAAAGGDSNHSGVPPPTRCLDFSPRIDTAGPWARGGSEPTRALEPLPVPRVSPGSMIGTFHQVGAGRPGEGSPSSLLMALAPLSWFDLGTAFGPSSRLGLAARTVDATCGLVRRLRALLSHAAEGGRTRIARGALSVSRALGLLPTLGALFLASHAWA
jgi:hypothetical protein